jgi:hypothetical protein
MTISIARRKIPKREDFIDSEQKMTLAAMNFLGGERDLLEALIAAFGTDELSILIETVEDRSYHMVVDAKFARAVNEITTVSEAGTCTVTGLIDGVALGGTENSASVTEETQAHSADNEIEIGTDFVLAVSDNASCENLTVTIKTTRSIVVV